MNDIRTRLIAWDHKTSKHLQERPLWLKPFMQAVTFIGGAMFTTLLTLFLVIMLRRLENVFFSNLFLVVAVVMVVFGFLIKYVWRRKRPDTEYARNMFFASYSFPSGHSLDSTLLYGTLTYFISLHLSAWQGAFCALGCILLVLSIAYSRVYLGAHYILDVVAGILLGSALLLTIILLIG